MKVRSKDEGSFIDLRRLICAIGLALSLFSGDRGTLAQGLPESVAGKAQVYDGITFDLM